MRVPGLKAGPEGDFMPTGLKAGRTRPQWSYDPRDSHGLLSVRTRPSVPRESFTSRGASRSVAGHRSLTSRGASRSVAGGAFYENYFVGKVRAYIYNGINSCEASFVPNSDMIPYILS